LLVVNSVSRIPNFKTLGVAAGQVSRAVVFDMAAIAATDVKVAFVA